MTTVSVKPLIIVSGPTASGKTSTSIAIAKNLIANQFQCEIVNYDSLYFYKELSIGTAKPTLQEMDGIPHHGISITSISNNFNAADFVDFALPKLNELWTKDIIPILVGGSPFYIRALIKGMYDSPTISDDVTEKVKRIYKEEGIGKIINELKINDPNCLDYLHENDHYRLTRALEFFYQTGQKISDHKKKTDEKDPFDFSENQIEGLKQYHCYLDLPKEDHFEIIKSRASQMLKDGLLEEVKALLAKGFKDEKALGSIGYKETIQYLADEFDSQEEYLERISISTRQLAKSQRTFYKKIRPKVEYHPVRDRDKILKETLEFIKSK
ncbi:MAG: tRNA (adenosine(37)-N6)-dimethylallyltransferase MiaA [Oligoflexia bacterium]|nr:tRNA (adenosine(37)-N6)-dimethylallyltransferase MiaA [Oligoflexia bacterium]